MNIATITNQQTITTNDYPTNVFLTTFNNMVVMLTLLQNATSIGSGLVTSISSNTLSINQHSRLFLDGSTRSMPSGQVAIQSNEFVYFENNKYLTSTTKPSGKTLIIGYYDGSTFTPYQIGNV